MENQDRAGSFNSRFGQAFLIADGMGGHRGGATAAAMAVERFEVHLNATEPGAAVQDALRRAAALVNAEIHETAHAGNPDTAFMATTVVIALLTPHELITGHAGDSRAYLFRDGNLNPLTRDHTAVQLMMDHNLLTEKEARGHPDASVITRGLGLYSHIDFEIGQPVETRPGDRLLLCSDGLSGYVDHTAIQTVLGQFPDAGQAAGELVRAALEAGGEDNITVQVIDIA